MQIREALNWALDRSYVVQSIFGGLATPKFTALTTSFPDYQRYSAATGAIETQYAYDLDKAKSVIEARMPALGAVKGVDGKWQYQGKPVIIIGLIRSEDQRLEIGNYFASQLEALGFTVDRQVKSRSQASPIWQGDPTTCQFNYYTASWVNSSITRDEGYMFAQFNSAQVQSIPLFETFQPSAALAAAEDALLMRNYSTPEQREQLFNTALTLSMKESWWGVWVVDNKTFEMYRRTLTSTSDLAGGFPQSRLWPYTIRWKGTIGGSAQIAQSGLLLAPWNPVDGSNWVEDAMIQQATEDWGVISDPNAGLNLPKLVQHADVWVKSGLPVTKISSWVSLNFQDAISVPDDAWADWDAAQQKFITAAERASADPSYQKTALVKTTVTYTPALWQTKWHDGSNFSMGDILMDMILTFDPGKPASKIYSETLDWQVDAFLMSFKGVRILSTEPLIIETYLDDYQLDAENCVKTWYPSDTYGYGTGAWHNLAPAILAEADGKIAFSSDKAVTAQIATTSLVSGPSLDVQAQYLNQVSASKTIPYAATLGQYVSNTEIAERYANLKRWYQNQGHLWIGTGPYFLSRPVASGLTLTRFADYIFPADEFSGYAIP